MSLQEITSSPFLSEEGLALAKSTVAAIFPPADTPAEPGDAPPPVARKVVDMFNLVASGVNVEIIPVETELTVSQASEFLRTSERHVNDLLDAGKIAFRMNGSERMVQRDSLLEFERERERTHDFLNELLELSQEIDPDND